MTLAMTRTGTLAAAGERLGVDASTVFRALQRIERGLLGTSAAGAGTSVTLSDGARTHTPLYAAPEQRQGGAVAPRAPLAVDEEEDVGVRVQVGFLQRSSTRRRVFEREQHTEWVSEMVRKQGAGA